jgi:hypothetical protein
LRREECDREDECGMAVAHDLNLLAEQQRKETARVFVLESAQRLYKLRQKTASLEAGDLQAWQDARTLAQDLVRAATPLGLGLLVACAKEVLHFAERRFSAERMVPDLSLYMLSALATLGMELERLEHDHDLR